MDKDRTVITCDERTLILFQAIINQGNSIDDAFIMLHLQGEEKENFLKRTNLSDKLDDFNLLSNEIDYQIYLLSEKRKTI